MSFEDGNYITDLENIKKLNLNKNDISMLVSKIFCEQMYRHGFVHCDPHEANLLVRKHPFKKGQPQIVLLDHGLYKKLGDDLHVRRVLFTIKLLHKGFELLCSLLMPFGWVYVFYLGPIDKI
jgi:predicted unusual protein kinase regulating ubiquinone biosynthesis (AarF/ABC1/UbiB family)